MDESVEVLDSVGVQIVDDGVGITGCYQFVLFNLGTPRHTQLSPHQLALHPIVVL